MTPPTIGGRIKAARKLHKLTQDALSEAIGIQRPAISQWEADKTTPNYKYLDIIAKTLNVSTHYLLNGAREGDDQPSLTLVEVGRKPSLPTLPEISWRDAATWPWVEDAEAGRRQQWHCPVPCGVSAYVLRVDVPSLYGAFRQDTLLFVDPGEPVTSGRLVIVRLDAHGTPVLRRYLEEGGKPYLEALNPAWPERFVAMPDDANLLGVVIFSGSIE